VSVLQRPACSFSRAADKFVAEGIKVVAVSVDDREKTEALVEKYKLSFPVAYGADARAVSAVTGAFVNDDPVYLQATGFVLNPEGRRFFVVLVRHVRASLGAHRANFAAPVVQAATAVIDETATERGLDF
jgi:peroxiredoxin